MRRPPAGHNPHCNRLQLHLQLQACCGSYLLISNTTLTSLFGRSSALQAPVSLKAAAAAAGPIIMQAPIIDPEARGHPGTSLLPGQPTTFSGEVQWRWEFTIGRCVQRDDADPSPAAFCALMHTTAVADLQDDAGDASKHAIYDIVDPDVLDAEQRPAATPGGSNDDGGSPDHGDDYSELRDYMTQVGLNPANFDVDAIATSPDPIALVLEHARNEAMAQAALRMGACMH